MAKVTGVTRPCSSAVQTSEHVSPDEATQGPIEVDPIDRHMPDQPTVASQPNPVRSRVPGLPRRGGRQDVHREVIWVLIKSFIKGAF